MCHRLFYLASNDRSLVQRGNCDITDDNYNPCTTGVLSPRASGDLHGCTPPHRSTPRLLVLTARVALEEIRCAARARFSLAKICARTKERYRQPA